MTDPATLDQWLAHPLDADVRAALERLREADDVVAVAVMPDVHLASEVCIGVALATRSRLLPAAVGSDIGCGMAALGFDGEAEALFEAGPRVLARLGAAIPVIRHRARSRPQLPDALIETPLSADALERAKRHDAIVQLGSLGRGNHFVELQHDDQGSVWAMVHTGSRGIGQSIRNWHEQHATPDTVGLRGIAADSEAGRAYLSDLEWALRYADENRRRILDIVAQVLSDELGWTPLERTRIECQHNFVRCEQHEHGALWVHRKGAISARDGEPGIIPGSMGSTSFLVEGRGHPRSLCSSSHGAGRAMRRGEAQRKVTIKQLRRELRGVVFDERLIEHLRDEAPSAYKDIGAVMRAQRELTRVITRLRPLLAFKGV